MRGDLKTPKQIPLTQGKVAIVSAEDYEAFSAFKWHAAKCNGRYYARRSISRPGQSALVVSMHREVPTVRGGALVDHINGDGLDNRRENLRVASASQNSLNLQAAHFKGGGRCVFLQHGRYVVRVAKQYGGCFDNEPEAAFAANLMLDKLSPGVGHRNPVDFDALISTLESRRDAISELLSQVLEARRAN